MKLWENARIVPMADAVPGMEVIDDGALLTDGESILAVGPREAVLSQTPLSDKQVEEVVDCGGGLVLPGLIDCHTHLVYGGDRSREFEQRLEGVSYQEISRQGGGIRSTDDVQDLLLAGADKVAVNSSAICNPNLIEDIAERFGSQCMVLSIEAQKKKDGWEAYYNNGREPSGLNVVDWVLEGQDRGVGEILLTSVDRDGTKKGLDIQLVRAAGERLRIPLIASGGIGTPQDCADAILEGGADAVAIATTLHYGTCELEDIRACCDAHNIKTRRIQPDNWPKRG